MKRARLLIAAPAVAAALLLAGCSSDSGEDAATSETVEETEEAAPEEEVGEEEGVEEEVVEESGGGAADAVANAEAAIEAAKAIPATDDLGEPIDISSLAGTEIISIPIDSALEFYQAGEAAMKANWQVSPVNSVAASIGKAAFFEPEAAKVPSRRVPPTIIKLCKVHSLVIGQGGGACLNIHRMQCSVGY